MLEKNYQEEQKILKLQISGLENKLESIAHDLTSAETTIVLKNTELDELQNDLKELDELREMKEVIIPESITVHF